MIFGLQLPTLLWRKKIKNISALFPQLFWGWNADSAILKFWWQMVAMTILVPKTFCPLLFIKSPATKWKMVKAFSEEHETRHSQQLLWKVNISWKQNPVSDTQTEGVWKLWILYCHRSGLEWEPSFICFNIYRILQERLYLGRSQSKGRQLQRRLNLQKRLKRATSLPTMTQILKTFLSQRAVISSEDSDK